MTTRTVAYERPTFGLADGAVGGLVAGAAMGMMSMVLFPSLGVGGFWQPLYLIAAVFDQSWGTIEGFAMLPALVGMMIHMMNSVLLGLLFAWSASQTGGNVVLKAVIASVVLWVLMDFLVLPIVDPIMTRLFPEWLFAVVHVAFGLVLGGYLAWRGRQATETERVTSKTYGARS